MCTTSQRTANKKAETQGNAKGALTEQPKEGKCTQTAKGRPISVAETQGNANEALTERLKQEKRAQPAKGWPISMQKHGKTLKER